MTAKDAKNRFGEFLDAAQRAPVSVTKNGRDVAVLMSREDYDRFAEIEDVAWSARAKDVLDTADFMDPTESEAFLKQILSRDAGS